MPSEETIFLGPLCVVKRRVNAFGAAGATQSNGAS